MFDIFIPELKTPFVFRPQPVSIPADMRPAWRIGIILMLLRKCCRNNRSTFGRVHVLSWASRTSDNQTRFLAVLDGDSPPDSLLVRIEPSVNRAVDLASAHGWVRMVGGDRIELTEEGVRLADQLGSANDLFLPEKAFMSSVGRKATENFVTGLFASPGRL